MPHKQAFIDQMQQGETPPNDNQKPERPVLDTTQTCNPDDLFQFPKNIIRIGLTAEEIGFFAMAIMGRRDDVPPEVMSFFKDTGLILFANDKHIAFALLHDREVDQVKAAVEEVRADLSEPEDEDVIADEAEALE